MKCPNCNQFHGRCYRCPFCKIKFGEYILDDFYKKGQFSRKNKEELFLEAKRIYDLFLYCLPNDFNIGTDENIYNKSFSFDDSKKEILKAKKLILYGNYEIALKILNNMTLGVNFMRVDTLSETADSLRNGSRTKLDEISELKSQILFDDAYKHILIDKQKNKEKIKNISFAEKSKTTLRVMFDPRFSYFDSFWKDLLVFILFPITLVALLLLFHHDKDSEITKGSSMHNNEYGSEKLEKFQREKFINKFDNYLNQ